MIESDLSNVQLFLGSLKSISDILRDVLGTVRTKDATDKIGEINSKLMEAQSLAIAAYDDQQSLYRKVNTLELELREIKDFRREKENYVLQNIGDTAFVYAYQPPEESTKPAHWLCSTCCDQDRKSMLQYQHRDAVDNFMAIWNCGVCNSRISVEYTYHP